MTDQPIESQSNEQKLTWKHPLWVFILPLAILIFFDQITWSKAFGLQYFLLILLSAAGVMGLAWVEKRHIPWKSYLLLIPMLGAAGMTVFRSDGATTFANVLVSLLSLVLFTISLLNGQWLGYRFRESLMGFLLLVQSVIIDPVRLALGIKKQHQTKSETDKDSSKSRMRSILVGLLIALPFILILGGLLAAADLVFADRLSSLFSWWKFDKLGETLFRTVYVLVLSYILCGVFIHALERSTEQKTLEPDKPLLTPFLGHVEAITVLGAINLLFAGFLVVQVRYFFAGQANISVEGFTYAEYARRGFFELVAVALISLGLFYIFSMITKQNNKKQHWVLSVLGILLLAQVGVMLVSAFQRLSLYEQAYGFTQLRTLTHVFMIWLGVMLAAVALMELTQKFKRAALVLFLVLVGFTLTLNLLHVDRFIVKQNLAHAQAGNPLDGSYLVFNIGNDGVPALFEAYADKETPEDLKENLAAVLACRYKLENHELTNETFWASYRYPNVKVNALIAQNKEMLESSDAFFEMNEGIFIRVDGEDIWCGDWGNEKPPVD